jgi:hypothetical protein
MHDGSIRTLEAAIDHYARDSLRRLLLEIDFELEVA